MEASHPVVDLPAHAVAAYGLLGTPLSVDVAAPLLLAIPPLMVDPALAVELFVVYPQFPPPSSGLRGPHVVQHSPHRP